MGPWQGYANRTFWQTSRENRRIWKKKIRISLVRRLCWLAYYRLCVNLCVGKRHYTLQDNIHLISLMLQVSYHTIDLCFVLFMFTSKMSIIRSEIISISIMHNPFLPFAVIPSSTVCLLLKCSNATVL